MTVTMRRSFLILCLIAGNLFVGSVLFAQESKTEEPAPEPLFSTFSSISLFAAGGPDAFGYTYDDHAGVCTYDFVDIGTTGTFLTDGDEISSVVTLAEPFNIYGTEYSQLSASTNGYISTDPSDIGGDLSNDCPLPSPLSSGGGARLYPLHDDIDMEPGIGRLLTQYFPTCPRPSQVGGGIESCTVFQWDQAAHFRWNEFSPTFDFQAILYHTSFQIVFQIGPGNPELGEGSTTGIQNHPPATTGLTYACNTFGSIPDRTAVCFFNPQGGIPPEPPTPTPVVAPPQFVSVPVPLCSDLDGSSNPIVRASLPSGVYATFCRVIAENGEFIRSAAEIGVQSVLDLGVIHAVDVFSPAGESGAGTNLCLQGSGGIIFLSSLQSPRAPQWLQSYENGGYTCAALPGTGTAVLVRNS